MHPLSISCVGRNSSINIGICLTNSNNYSDYLAETGYFNTDLYDGCDDSGGSLLITDCMYSSDNGGIVTGTTDAEDIYVQCNISTSMLAGGGLGLAGTSIRYANMLWKPINSNTFAPLPIPPLAVTLVSTPVPTLTECSINVDLNLVDTTQSDAACELYLNNYSVLDLPCTADNTISDESVYEVLNCETTCGNYLVAAYGDCCATELIDCAGVCNGNAIYETDSTYDGLTYCCTNIDACNVCNGTDFTGTDCGTGILLETGTGSNALYTTYDMHPYFANGALVNETSNLTITNNNSEYSMVLYFDLSSGTMKNDPYIEILYEDIMIADLVNLTKSKSIVLPVNASITVEIKSNVYRLVSAIQENPSEVSHGWEVKQIEVHYEVDSFWYSAIVNVYPSSANCFVIGEGTMTVSNTCSQLPGCIFCRDFHAMRILRLRGGNNDSEVSLISTIQDTSSVPPDHQDASSMQSRVMYTTIVPPFTTPVDQEAGFCANGWLTQQCDYSLLHQFHPKVECSTSPSSSQC